jgi:general secretion pathway protein M
VNAALPSGWQGRLLALAVLAAALATVYVTLAMPLLDFYDDRQALAARERRLIVKLGSVGAELPELQARLARLRAAVASHKATLAGETDAIASATLQGRLEQYATAAGVTIGSSEILPEEPRGNYHRIGLRLMVNGPYQGLLELVARIETATPPLAIDNLQIRGARSALLRRQAAAIALDASLEVYGFRDAAAGRPKP